MCNDLEGAVCNEYPEIREIKEKIKREGARLSLMSGSGSTVFGVFEDKDSAENARSHFNGIWTAIVKTMR
jgi:4-diphosphocytidyl-2-C-methyl-D-erythritol kinase